MGFTRTQSLWAQKWRQQQMAAVGAAAWQQCRAAAMVLAAAALASMRIQSLSRVLWAARRRVAAGGPAWLHRQGTWDCMRTQTLSLGLQVGALRASLYMNAATGSLHLCCGLDAAVSTAAANHGVRLRSPVCMLLDAPRPSHHAHLVVSHQHTPLLWICCRTWQQVGQQRKPCTSPRAWPV